MNFYMKICIYKLLFFFFLSPFLYADIFPFQTIEKANEAYEKGEFHKSARLFKSLKKDDPSVAYNQANAQYKAGMYDEALKSYTQAKGIDEATREHNIGNSYFKKNDLNHAIASYENALKIREDEDTRYNLELAKKQQEEQKKQQHKNKDKQKEDEKKKAKEKKQQKHQEQKNRKDQKDKAPQKKKEKAEKNMAEEEKLRKKELSHLLKQLSKKKMPTMMYQATEEKGVRHDQNPW